MTRVLPDWQPFDPDRPEAELPELPTPDGPILALLVSPGLHGDGWAGRAAKRIAGRGIAGNGRILLADLGLDRPSLHEVLGVGNGEGMSDAFVFGASIQRVARPTEEGFLFASAGTPVAEPSSVLASPRWGPVAEAFQQAGAHLLLYVPWDLPGRDALLRRASSVVILAGPEEVGELEADALEGAPVDVILGPGASVEDGPSRSGTTGAGAAAETPVETGGRGVASGPIKSGEPAAASTARSSAAGSSEGTEARSTGGRQGRGGRLGLLILLAVLLLLGVLGAALLGFIDIPGIPEVTAGPSGPADGATDASRAAAPAPDAAEGMGETEGVEETAAAAASRPLGGPHHAWSLMIASFQDPTVGLEQAAALQRAHPGRLFHLAPVYVGGTTWYRLLVGPAGDSLAVEEFVEDLNAGSGAGWRIRPTPLAFQLAEVARAEEARALIRELPAEIPAYLLAVRPGGSDGDADFFADPDASGASPGTRFRVYAGAYADAGEATSMGEILRGAGFGDAPLVSRVGFVPPESDARQPPAGA